MRKVNLCKQALIMGFISSYSVISAQLTPQQNEQLGQIFGGLLGSISNDIKQGKTNKLKKQKTAISSITAAIEDMGKDNTKGAAQNAELAIESFPKYSIPYLISAYGAVEEGDFLKSNRMLALYSKFKKNKINDSINNYIPKDLTEEIIKQSNDGFSKLTEEDLKNRYKKESWLNQTVEIFISPSMDVFSDNNSGTINYRNGSSVTFPEILSDNNISIVYKKYFWLNQANNSPKFNNNYGVILNGGLNTSIVFPSNDYGAAFPSNLSAFVSPGIQLKKLYIIPFQVNYSKVFDYPDKSDSYTKNSNFYVNLLPEVRLYTGFLNPLAQDGRKNPNQTNWGGYFFLKFPYYRFVGSNSNNESYKQEKHEVLAGFSSGWLGKRNGFNMTIGLGYGENTIYQTVSNESFHLEGSYFKLEISVGIRIF